MLTVRLPAMRGRRRRPAPASASCAASSGAYIYPGNFATNIAGGVKFGRTLLWVIVASNLMTMLIQTLSATLGIVTGRAGRPTGSRAGRPASR